MNNGARRVMDRRDKGQLTIYEQWDRIADRHESGYNGLDDKWPLKVQDNGLAEQCGEMGNKHNNKSNIELLWINM